jgi:hypothetical protein
MVRWHDGQRFVAALCRRGRSRLHLLAIEEGGVRVRQRPIAEEPALRPLEDYPVARAVRQFRRIGRRRGMSQEAKDMLARAEQAVRS